jgi:hypothetical protein
MSTFNGWTIISLPSTPAPKSIEWDLSDVVGAARSPFNNKQQIFYWGQGLMRASLSYPKMTNAQALPLITFLRDVQGITKIFQFGDPKRTGPQNPAAAAGVVSGANQTGYTLITTSSNLTPGDWIQLGLRLYSVTEVAGGTLGIWPNLRESPADGTDLVIANTQGLWRLTKNERRYTDSSALNVDPITFEIEEAL